MCGIIINIFRIKYKGQQTYSIWGGGGNLKNVHRFVIEVVYHVNQKYECSSFCLYPRFDAKRKDTR